MRLIVSALLLIFAVASQGERPQVPVSPDEVVRGDPSRPWITLAFNAGAGYDPAPEILDTLAEKGVRTTFFVMGWWAERNPELVQRIGAAHEVASHGHEVFDLTSVSDAAVRGDLEHADEVIGGLIGRSTRPLWSASAGYRDAHVRNIAASLGYRPIYWTVDSGDWTTDATPDGVARRVLDNASNGAIVVMHFESPRTRTSTAVVLPTLIDTLRERGYRLVTITELVTGVLDDAAIPSPLAGEG
jgi:peptidoglycan/xylan/chitin deacetylase (PgdA/CDA1 family)